MTDVLYHPLIDRDTDGLDKSPLFCSPDREKVAGTAALYLEELVPKRYRLIAREEHITSGLQSASPGKAARQTDSRPH